MDPAPGAAVLQGCPEYSGPAARGYSQHLGRDEDGELEEGEAWVTPKGLLASLIPLGSLRLVLEGCGFLGMRGEALSTPEEVRG